MEKDIMTLEIGDLVILVDDVGDSEQYGFVVSTYTSYSEEMYNVLWFGKEVEYPYYFNEITKVS